MTATIQFASQRRRYALTIDTASPQRVELKAGRRTISPDSLDNEEALAALATDTLPIPYRWYRALLRFAADDALPDVEHIELAVRTAGASTRLGKDKDLPDPAVPVFLALAACDPDSRWWALSNPAWPWLDDLEDAPVDVAASNPNCPRHILDANADDHPDDLEMWAALLRNPNCPPDLLERAGDFARGDNPARTTYGNVIRALEESHVYAERGTNPEHLWVVATQGRVPEVWVNPHLPVAAAVALAHIDGMIEHYEPHPPPYTSLADLYEAIADRADCTGDLRDQVLFCASQVRPGQHRLRR